MNNRFHLMSFEILALITYGCNILFLFAVKRPFFWGGTRIISMSSRIVSYFFLIFMVMTSCKFLYDYLTQPTEAKNNFIKLTARLFSSTMLRYLLGATLAFQITITGYSNVKQSMPIVSKKSYDHIGYHTDKMVSLHGHTISSIKQADIPPLFNSFIDWSYYAFFTYIIVVLAILLMAFPPNDIRIRFFLCGLVILWGIGVYSYYIFPMLGPVFYKPLHYTNAKNITLHAFFLQQKLHAYHSALMNFPDSYLPVPFMGIAAMPSFHVAETFYFALILFWIRSWAVRLIGVGMFLLTYFGSCYTGWHYFIDGIAGLAWALIVYFTVTVCIHYKCTIAFNSATSQVRKRHS